MRGVFLEGAFAVVERSERRYQFMTRVDFEDRLRPPMAAVRRRREFLPAVGVRYRARPADRAIGQPVGHPDIETASAQCGLKKCDKDFDRRRGLLLRLLLGVGSRDGPSALRPA